MERSKQMGIPLPDRELRAELRFKLKEHYRDGFKCFYCGQRMEVKASEPNFPTVFSFEHYVPLVQGGNNSLENIVFCCHACNIIKGTMTGSTFKELLEYVPPELVKKMYREIWRGRLADKMQRIRGANAI